MTSLRADEIGWELAPSWGPSSKRLLAVVIEVLPSVDDDLVVDLLEQLALQLLECDEYSKVVQEMLSMTLEGRYQDRQTIQGLRERLLEARKRVA